jgi:hypothetical protein
VNATVDFARFKNPPDAVERITEIIEREHRMINVSVMPDGTYQVLSWTQPGVVYEVIGDACHCPGAVANLLCWHVVAAESDRAERRAWEARSRELARPRITRIPVADLSPEDRDDEAATIYARLFGD